MRSRRIRSRFSRPVPKPEIVISVTPPAPPPSFEALEPSRQREREVYVPSDEDNAIVVRVTEELLASTEVEHEVKFDHSEYQRVTITVDESRAGALIGKRGAGLEAIELLLSRMASHQARHPIPVQVDVNEYRVRHEEDLRDEALSLAERVLRTGRDEELRPMSARDRRVVHLAIQEMEGLQTYSVGHGATKSIVIRRLNEKSE